MRLLKQLIILVSFFHILPSCIMTEQVRSLKVEVMKPGAFIFPENVEKIALFKRDLYLSDTADFKYLYKFYNQYGTKIDSTIRYSDLSNSCVDELSNFITTEGYFDEVKNYRDSLKYLLNNRGKLNNPDEIFNKTKADVCIFLDYFNFFEARIFTHVAYISPTLKWTVVFKNDSVYYTYNQTDKLTYGNTQSPEYFTKKEVKIKEILQNSSEYLAKSFGSKLFPNWIPVERIYYKSKNPDMIKAEEFAIKNDWLKAAEIWKQKVKSKNSRLKAKACYNMALAAEMEGKPDLAIEWLAKSYSALYHNNLGHRAYCQQYINVLALRKREIERLDKQIRKLKNIQAQTMHQ